MSTIAAIRRALSMVQPNVRVIVYLTSFGRMASGLLDLLGVAALGLFTSNALGGKDSELSQVSSNIIYGKIIDAIENPSVLLILSIACFLSKSLISYLLSVMLARSLYFESFSITNNLVQEYAFSDLETVSNRPTQEQHYIVTAGVKSSIYGVLNNFVSVLGDTFLIVLFVVMLGIASPLATLLISIILGSVALIVYKVAAKRLYRAGQDIGSYGIDSTRYFQEAAFGFRELKVSGRLKDFLDKFFYSEKKLSAAQVNQSIAALMPRYVMEASVMLCLGVVAAISFGLQDKSTALVTVTVFAASTARILPAILPIQSCLGDLRVNAGLATNFYNFMDSVTFIKSSQKNQILEVDTVPYTPETSHQRIQLKNASYRYPNAQANSVDGIDIDISGPSWVALVGPSGGGKSTIFDLMMGLRIPSEGTSTINGVMSSKFLETASNYCIYVPQRLTLVNSSLAENVAFGIPREDINTERVLQSLEAVGLLELVNRHESGAWQEIGEFGNQYSGGQGQRLGLARALYSDPKIILFDESTSSLDSSTEQLITDIIRSLADRILVVSISHRIETLRNVDQLLLLENGKITFRGPYAEFLSLKKEIE